MKILGVNGGNGVILYPMRRFLIGNYEPRSVFKTRENKQWKLNFPKVPLHNHPLDFYHNYTGKHIKYPIPDVIVGAPDCGHSSVLAYSRAKKLSNPLDNPSLDLYIRSILLLNPKIFMMENLPKMLELVGKEVIMETFTNYELIFHERSVIDWGNSQKNRKRLVLIGLSKQYFKENLALVRDYFTYIYRINSIKNCEELLKGIEDFNEDQGHVRESISDIITLYSGYKISLRDIQRFWKNHSDLRRWPVSDRKFSTAPGVYRNLKSDLPATARKANRQFNDRGLQMSPRELARIQGVPDKFQIYIDRGQLTYWINKGRATVTKTPPYEIGKWFYNQLKQIPELWK